MNNNVSRTPNAKQNMPKFSAHSHVFSLSLPRDNHLATYMEEKVCIEFYQSFKTFNVTSVKLLNTL